MTSFGDLNLKIPIDVGYSSGKKLRVKLTPSNLYLYSKNEVCGGQEKINNACSYVI